MKTNTTYAKRELAVREGNKEAAKLTLRGYPTSLVEVREVKVKGLELDGQCKSEQMYVEILSIRFEAVLSEDKEEQDFDEEAVADYDNNRWDA